MATTAKPTLLRQRLLEENAFVRKLIDTIPPKIYFNEEVNEYLEGEKHAFIDDSVKNFGWRAGKLNVKGKQKRARLDPHLHKTVSQIQEDVEKLNDRTEKQKKFAKANENLQAKLSEKIESLKSARMGLHGSNPEGVKLRTKELKKKMRKRKNKSYKTVTFDVTENREKTKAPVVTKEGKIIKSKFDLMDSSVTVTKKRNGKPKTEVPSFNKEGKIVYSKFDFMDAGETERNHKPSGRNKFKKALDKLNSEKEKLQELSSKDPEKGENLAKKLKWKMALNKAEGVKVKDNPELLKKSMKRRDFKKRRSQKQWAAREANVKKGMDERQAKRNKNIRAKKQKRIDKKVKLARKKGRFVNGF